MFSSLSNKLANVFKGIRNRGVLTQEIIDNAIREIRISLLDADVALPVVRSFINSLKESLSGQEIIKSTSPEQTITKYVNEELIKLLGDNTSVDSEKSFAKLTGSVLMCGLQGSGKTTTSAKLANMLSKKFKRKVLLVSLDLTRPAAVDQLNKLANQNDIPFFSDIDFSSDTPVSIASKVMLQAKNFDIVIFDTAGRMYVDDDLMNELVNISTIIKPVESLLVIDSMMGQDALNTANVFNDNVKLTGLIMTRIDGDNRGGACLSAKHVTGCQIKYMCTGEKIDDIEMFYPDRLASRILDNGDILSLVDKAIDQNMAGDLMDMKPGKEFNMNDMEKYFKQIEKIGGIGGFLRFMPGIGKIKEQLKDANIDEKVIKRQVAIIKSMTIKEKHDPKILNASRRRRIAAGAGVNVCEVNKLIKQYEGLKLMMSKMKKAGNNPRALMNMFKGM